MSELSPLTDVEESWHLIWFPPDVESKSRTFKSREAVDRFLKKQNEDVEVSYPAGEWAPILTHRLTTVVERTVPIRTETPNA